MHTLIIICAPPINFRPGTDAFVMYAHSATPAVSPKMREVDPEALALRGDVLPGRARLTKLKVDSTASESLTMASYVDWLSARNLNRRLGYF